jgi:anti-sigma B factor antagonist
MPYLDGNWQPPELVVDVEKIDVNTRVLALRGDIDVSTAPVLDDAFQAELNDGGARVVLDLGGVGFIDSTAMATMAEWRDRLIDAGGAFALVTGDPQQRRLFRLTALTDRLRVSATRDEAVTALDESGSGDERADRRN